MKKVVAVVLCMGLAVSLFARGKQTDSGSGSSEKIIVKYLRPGTAPQHNDELVKAINDKLEKDKMGFGYDVIYVPDPFQDKLTMMISAGDNFDLLAVMEDQRPLTSFIAMDGILPITKYVNNSQNLKKVIPGWMWDSATINSEIYTIPAYWTDLADQASCITYRKEKLDEFGIKPPETMDDLLEMARIFTEKWTGTQKPVIIPMYRDPFTWLFRTLDTYPFTVIRDLVYVDQKGNVKNWLETPEFKACAEFFEKCYAGGYVPTDIFAQGWSSWNTMLSGNFIWVDGCQLWGTRDVWKERIPGTELDTVYLNPKGPSFRPASFRNDTAVSATSAYPAEAVKFMDWIYSKQENYDLMVYGIEGLTFKDAGPKAYTSLIPNFEFNPDWMIGNLNYSRFEVGTYEKFIQIMGTEKPKAENSIIINFTFDPTPVATEYMNCEAEVIASIYPMKVGVVPYSRGYSTALAKMKAAGIDRVIAEYQRQVNEYLKKQ
jgi:putative aldouronate transport system substrate-binding protein